MIRLILIGLNPIKFNYYPYMINLDKFVSLFMTKICLPSKTKNVNIKLVSMLTKINQVETLEKRILYDFKCKFDSVACNSNHKWNNNRC